MPKLLKISLIVIGVLIALITLIVALIYFWPVRSSDLQKAVVNPLSYSQAVDTVSDLNRAEAQRGVTSTCQSSLKTMLHGTKTAKAVVMFHGVTACPKQYKVLAQTFYDAGYNVYVPVAPHHGTINQRTHSAVRSSELVDYVNSSLNIGRGLGDELGVVGLSGGGMLATWAAEYHPDIQRALILSPFYEPSVSQAPKWQLPFLKKLYGYHILPDQYSNAEDSDNPGFSYRALANYLILTDNLKQVPDKLPLKSIGLVTSGSDKDIDLDLAQRIPRGIATANNLPLHFVHLPADWNAGHDIVDPDNSEGLRNHQEQLLKLYFDLYEGRSVSL